MIDCATLMSGASAATNRSSSSARAVSTPGHGFAGGPVADGADNGLARQGMVSKRGAVGSVGTNAHPDQRLVVHDHPEHAMFDAVPAQPQQDHPVAAKAGQAEPAVLAGRHG